MSKAVCARFIALLCLVCLIPLAACGEIVSDPVITLRDVGGNYILFNWSGLDQGDVMVFYRVSGSGGWLLLDTVSGHSYALRDLTPDTSYDLRVIDDVSEAELTDVRTASVATAAPTAEATPAATEIPETAASAEEPPAGAEASTPSDAGTVWNDVAGDSVLFGSYPQTAGGGDQTPIEWQVLAVDGSRELLISRYALDVVPFNETEGSTSWSSCSLRAWLNGTFLETAFTEAERQAIVSTELETPDVTWVVVYRQDSVKGSCGTDYTTACENTQDSVFLLSVDEMSAWLGSNELRKCVATPYAIAKGAFRASLTGKTYLNWNLKSAGDPDYAQIAKYTGDASEYFLNGAGCTAYWMRSSGYTPDFGSIVNTNGQRFDTIPATSTQVAVRPALWLDTDRNTLLSVAQ